MTMHAEPTPEFSRVVKADAVQRKEMAEPIEANAEERAALARRFELEAIDSLTATVRLKRVRGGQMIRVAGALEADVVQTCVVTLESVRNHVSESFEALFAPPDLVPDVDADVEFDFATMDEDLPEPMVNNRIDIGELTAQHLSLALDPYPRCPGVELPPEYAALEEDAAAAAPEDAAETRPNPFAALEKLKRPH